MKSECAELNELVSAFVDGELAGEELARVERHLAACEECRAFAEECRLLEGAVGKSLHAPEVKLARWEAMRAQLRAAARSRASARRSGFRKVKAAAFLATAAAACLLVVALLAPWSKKERDYISAENIITEYVASDCPATVVTGVEGGLDMLVITDLGPDEAEEQEQPEAGEEQ